MCIFGVKSRNKIMELKAFTDCSLVYLEKTFGLIQEFNEPALEQWLSVSIELSDHERRELRDFQEPLTLNVLHWNEQELSLNFIGPIFALVRFTSRKFLTFLPNAPHGPPLAKSNSMVGLMRLLPVGSASRRFPSLLFIGPSPRSSRRMWNRQAIETSHRQQLKHWPLC